MKMHEIKPGDISYWIEHNSAELEQQMEEREPAILSTHKNGEVMVEYVRDMGLDLTCENLVRAADVSGYRERMAFAPPKPAPPQQTIADLRLTGRQIKLMSKDEMKALINRSDLGSPDENVAAINGLLAASQPSETPGFYSEAEKLYQAGAGVRNRDSLREVAKPTGPTGAERKAANLKSAQNRWDAEKARIDSIVIPGPMGKPNWARTEAAQKEARNHLGKRPS